MSQIRITCAVPARMKPEVWCAQLAAALPEARTEVWTSGSPPADYALVWQPDPAFFPEQPHLKAIFNAGAGVDALLKLDLPEGVPLVRLEDAGMGAQMAEYAAFAALRYYRGFDRYAEQAHRGEWVPHAPPRLAEWPIGILGYGVLGRQVAKTLSGFGFTVHGWKRKPDAESDVQLYCGSDQLADFLRATRLLICLLPLTPATHEIINRHTLAWLPQGACMINLARGGLVNEADVLAALDSGHLAGLTTDVCCPEPAPTDHPFWRHPKVLLTPHCAAITLRENAIAQIAGKIRALEAGQEINGIVDKKRGY